MASAGTASVADAVSLARTVGMTILVVEANRAKAKDLTAAIQRMAIGGVRFPHALLVKYDGALQLYSY